jgi:hypothetical protein
VVIWVKTCVSRLPGLLGFNIWGLMRPHVIEVFGCGFLMGMVHVMWIFAPDYIVGKLDAETLRVEGTGGDLGCMSFQLLNVCS